MKTKLFASFIIVLLFTSCASATPSAPVAQVVNVYASPATEPWLSKLYTCASTTSAVINITPDSPDISIRIGEPQGLAFPAFQIGADDLLVVVNRLSPLQNMNADQVREVFAGSGDAPTQVWVYAAGEDIQNLFDTLIMNGRAVSPSARLAVSAQQMSDTLNADLNTVGILPRRWKAGDTREIFSIPAVPVLAITPAEPTGAIADLIACLQK